VGQGATETPTCHHVTTLTNTASWPNPKNIAACEVLAHPRAAFHPCTCGLRDGATVVAAALISYSDAEVAAGTRTWRRLSTTSSTPTCDYG
jgi:hypothetical protein